MKQIHLTLAQAHATRAQWENPPADVIIRPHPQCPDEPYLRHVVFPEIMPAMFPEGAKPDRFMVSIDGRRFWVHVGLQDWSSPEGDGTIDFYETLDPMPSAAQGVAHLRDKAWAEGPVVYAGTGDRTVRIGGQPDFLQNPVIPQKDGRAFRPLATLETEWGDAGNINLFVWLDANNIPAAACYEASCL